MKVGRGFVGGKKGTGGFVVGRKGVCRVLGGRKGVCWEPTGWWWSVFRR